VGGTPLYSDESESEIDSDGPALSGDCYPLDLEAGEDDDGKCGEDAEDGSGMDMEEMLVQGEWAVQGAKYLDQQAFEGMACSWAPQAEGH